MLNYMGPNVGPGPVVSSLPAPAPGTMPQGVPGLARANATPNLPPPHAAPHPAVHGHAAPPMNALAAILRHPALNGGAPPVPQLPQYATTTQTDGTVLLHIKNPDGSLGPIVKVLPAIKRADATPAQVK